MWTTDVGLPLLSAPSISSSIAREPGRFVVGLRSRSRRAARISALHARAELAQVERLGHVRVGAGLEALDLVVDAGERGQHQDRRARPHHVGLEPARDLEPVDPRHHHVEDEQVGVVRLDQLQRLVAVARAQAQEAGVTERHVDHVRDGVVVLGDHDLLEEHRTALVIPPIGRPRQTVVSLSIPCSTRLSRRRRSTTASR